ncbi:hypothetical protein SAMN05444156_2086 [Verrucomicrobium sp. GAS474]|nr:hypothetical protein SAMN05444156_2086 [Verrucomicrobium sp. GAS474]
MMHQRRAESVGSVLLQAGVAGLPYPMPKPKMRMSLENEVIAIFLLFYLVLSGVLLYVHYREGAPSANPPARSSAS